MLLDPYFALEAFPHVLHFTAVDRILVGPRAETKALALALEALPTDRELTIRVSDAVHDRFVIPGSGPVDHLGTSLSGLGKRLSVSTVITPPVADAIRAHMEKSWQEAEPVEAFAARPTSAPAPRRKRPSKPRTDEAAEKPQKPSE